MGFGALRNHSEPLKTCLRPLRNLQSCIGPLRATQNPLVPIRTRQYSLEPLWMPEKRDPLRFFTTTLLQHAYNFSTTSKDNL